MTHRSPACAYILSSAAVAALAVLAPGPALAQQAPPASASASSAPLTVADWRADLRFLADSLPKAHLKLFHNMAPAEFDSAVRRLDADIPSLDSTHVAVRLMQLCALIQDGHSGLRPPHGPGAAPRVPVWIERYSDGVFVRAAAPRYAAALGGRVVAVGSVPIEEALKRAESIVSHDPLNDGQRRAWATIQVFGDPALLYGLDLAARTGGAELTLEKAGRRSTMRIAATDSFALRGEPFVPTGFRDARPPSAPVPLSIPHEREAQWLVSVPECRAVYFQFNAVQNGDSTSLEETARRLARMLESPDVDRLVIDLRNNGGGNNTLLRPLLLAIIRSRINHRGGLFALIGPRTFSAAQNFCNRLENFADVIFVGEPTGQNVNFYGDTRTLVLPHSGLRVAASFLWWQDMDPRDRRAATYPEIAIGRGFQDYVAGRDRALEAALKDPPPAGIEDWLSPVLSKGPDSLGARYDAWRSDPRHQHLPDPEVRLNTFGYKLLGAHRVPDAVAVLDLVARTRPDSWNAFDSLGEAHAAARDTAKAIEAYRRSLQLNPKNDNGRTILARLEAGSK